MYPILGTTPQSHDDDLAFSALPDAPVVAEGGRRPRAAAVRAAVAATLHAAARAVEPAPQARQAFRTGPGVCA